MKIQSLSTHPDANEVWVKFFSPHKTAGVFKGERHCNNFSSNCNEQ